MALNKQEKDLIDILMDLQNDETQYTGDLSELDVFTRPVPNPQADSATIENK